MCRFLTSVGHGTQNMSRLDMLRDAFAQMYTLIYGQMYTLIWPDEQKPVRRCDTPASDHYHVLHQL